MTCDIQAKPAERIMNNTTLLYFSIVEKELDHLSHDRCSAEFGSAL